MAKTEDRFSWYIVGSVGLVGLVAIALVLSSGMIRVMPVEQASAANTAGLAADKESKFVTDPLGILSADVSGTYGTFEQYLIEQDIGDAIYSSSGSGTQTNNVGGKDFPFTDYFAYYDMKGTDGKYSAWVLVAESEKAAIEYESLSSDWQANKVTMNNGQEVYYLQGLDTEHLLIWRSGDKIIVVDKTFANYIPDESDPVALAYMAIYPTDAKTAVQSNPLLIQQNIDLAIYNYSIDDVRMAQLLPDGTVEYEYHHNYARYDIKIATNAYKYGYDANVDVFNSNALAQDYLEKHVIAVAGANIETYQLINGLHIYLEGDSQNAVFRYWWISDEKLIHVSKSADTPPAVESDPVVLAYAAKFPPGITRVSDEQPKFETETIEFNGYKWQSLTDNRNEHSSFRASGNNVLSGPTKIRSYLTCVPNNGNEYDFSGVAYGSATKEGDELYHFHTETWSSNTDFGGSSITCSMDSYIPNVNDNYNEIDGTVVETYNPNQENYPYFNSGGLSRHPVTLKPQVDMDIGGGVCRINIEIGYVIGEGADSTETWLSDGFDVPRTDSGECPYSFTNKTTLPFDIPPTSRIDMYIAAFGRDSNMRTEGYAGYTGETGSAQMVGNEEALPFIAKEGAVLTLEQQNTVMQQDSQVALATN